MLGLGLAAYFGSLAIHGNGFIAAFVGGIVFRAITKNHLAEATEFTENVGTFLSVLVWGIFGAVLLPLALQYTTNLRPPDLCDPQSDRDPHGAGGPRAARRRAAARHGRLDGVVRPARPRFGGLHPDGLPGIRRRRPAYRHPGRRGRVDDLAQCRGCTACRPCRCLAGMLGDWQRRPSVRSSWPIWTSYAVWRGLLSIRTGGDNCACQTPSAASGVTQMPYEIR